MKARISIDHVLPNVWQMFQLGVIEQVLLSFMEPNEAFLVNTQENSTTTTVGIDISSLHMCHASPSILVDPCVVPTVSVQPFF